jgi:DNA-directed RNA polymerase subunit RPC12/RpoP
MGDLWEESLRGDIMPYRQPTSRDRWKTGLYILLTITVIIVTGLLLIQMFETIGLVVWLAVFVMGIMLLLVRWHAKNTAYRCRVCGHEFEISTGTDLISPHLPEKKYLRCPQCGKRSWKTVLVKDEGG